VLLVRSGSFGQGPSLEEQRAAGDYLARKRSAEPPGLGWPHERGFTSPRRRWPLAGLAAAAPAEPARPGGGSRGVPAAPELRRDRTLEAESRAHVAPGRAPRRPLAGAQRAAPRRGVRAGAPADPPRRARDGAGARRAGQDPHRPRAVPRRRRRPP